MTDVKKNLKQKLGLDLRRFKETQKSQPQPTPTASQQSTPTTSQQSAPTASQQPAPQHPASQPEQPLSRKNSITERQQLILLSEYAANKEILSNDAKAALNGKITDVFCHLCGYLARSDSYRDVLSTDKFADEKIPGLLKYISNQDLFSDEVSGALAGAARSDLLFDLLQLIYSDSELVRSVMDSEGTSGARRKQVILIGYGWETGSKLFAQKSVAIQEAKKAGVKNPKIKMYAFWATEDRKYASSVNFEELANLIIDQATLINKLVKPDTKDKIKNGDIATGMPEELNPVDLNTIIKSEALAEYHTAAGDEEISTLS